MKQYDQQKINNIINSMNSKWNNGKTALNKEKGQLLKNNFMDEHKRSDLH